MFASGLKESSSSCNGAVVESGNFVDSTMCPRPLKPQLAFAVLHEKSNSRISTMKLAYRDVVALSDAAAQYAGDHTAEVQHGHAAAPAII